MDPKKIAFEYFVYQLHNWYKEAYGNINFNDLSTLKVLKLLFFTVAAGTNRNSVDTLLDNTFNNFCAMPYGHVESDVYTYIKYKQLHNISLDTSDSSIIADNFNIDSELKKKIDDQILIIKTINFNLIKYTSFELVDLSHNWYSWQKNYEEAKSKGIYSQPISVNDIKSEIKIYQL